MSIVLPLMLLAAAAPQSDHPKTYLVSIVDLPLNSGESLESFSISTWGVEFNAVCKIPGGWRIKSGNSATPDGVLEGEGSQGATWFNQRSPDELHQFAVLTLFGEIQQSDVENGPDATFKGVATISTPDGERQAALSFKNVLLTAAGGCPRR